jgi:two-component system LytT family response regulator
MLKIKKIKNEVLDSKPVLKTVVENQIALEKYLQKIIKSNQVKTVTVNSASTIDFISINDIVYCRSDSSYTTIILFNKKMLTSSKQLKEFEELFIYENFIRISKSLLINTKQIQSYNKRTGQVTMKGNTVLEVSRRKKADFLTIILQ